MDNAWVHSLDPFAIQFTDEFGIRWYGLAYLAGFFVTYLLVRYMYKRGTTPLTPESCSDFITLGAIGVLGGGRIGYVLFYSPELLVKFSSSFPFWGALEVHKGGMSSHGGILGVILACWFFGRKVKISGFHLLDITTLSGALAFFFGRIANFINGELYGRVAHEGYKWGVKFPAEIYQWGQAQATQLKALAPAVEKLQAFQLGNRQLDADTDTWFGWVAKYDSWAQYNIDVYKEKLVLATQMGNKAVIEAIGPALTTRYPSQLYQSFMEGFLVFALLSLFWFKPRKPGVISGWFGILYALMRIAGEQYRMPDAHLGFQALGLTRGQWLSFGLLALGIAFVAYALRLPGEPMGGWRKQP